MNMTTIIENPEAAHLEKLRSQLSTDMEAMQQKEASLHVYEQRLNARAENSPPSRPPQQLAPQYFVAPVPNTAELDSEWEKYNRAHALLEAARRGLCDDRLALKEREERFQAHEVEVARREAWVKVREHELDVLVQARDKAAAEAKARPTFSSAPFLAARNLFTRQS
jgi:hypothetical protein